MLIESSDMACCGVREISSLSYYKTAEGAMKDFLTDTSPMPNDYGPPYRRDKFRYAVFSGTKRSKYVERFSAFITTNKLGEVIETGWNKNPNSGNNLKVCVWTIDWEAVAAYRAVQETKDGKGKPSKAVEAEDIV